MGPVSFSHMWCTGAAKCHRWTGASLTATLSQSTPNVAHTGTGTVMPLSWWPCQVAKLLGCMTLHDTKMLHPRPHLNHP